ncbi:MAG TPA: nuclear transport factor 2 family protein [Solirubrobacterales bacterium]|nr:nuclear transport factor 2 family protein [Solirubrobacterales bacterium]
MVEDRAALVERLFDAFNRRDVEGIVELCDPEMEFLPVTAEEIHRMAPYVGPEGLHSYLDDVGRLWDELLIMPKRIESHESLCLVYGRVYLRSRDLGIRDMPAAWLWELRGARFVRGEVFADPDLAATRFAAIFS